MSNPARIRRKSSLGHSSSSHPPNETATWRRRAAAMRPCAEVESLLRAQGQTGDFLEDPVFSTMTVDEPPLFERPSSVIGPYKLLQQIGEGGMGIVFMADQTYPIHRKVALKIIKPGMNSRQVIARFEAERQALAMMEHPNIAKVLDAGATATGRPYFVMELVKGVPITDYCDQARLSPRERLELLVPVCMAIQHAHQKGVIHRDIKPSNVLVSLYDGHPVPKVIDFGVAKAIEQRLTERTLYTQHGAIVGTLEYMSPEQAENSALDIDTRTDVYALGVLLFELLTGTTPLERQRLRQAAYLEIVRRIREEDPPKPSSRLSKTEQIAAIAARRNMEPRKLARVVRGELDWIAMKALEKDRTRRYATASDLARDLQRYLADEPVEAGPPSARYRLRKFAGKHRAALATAVAFAAVLVAATGVSLWQAIRATRSEREAKAVLAFFSDKVLAAPRPRGRLGGLGHDVTLRAAVDAAESVIASDFAAQPNVEAAIRDTLGTTYLYLGEPTLAIPQHQRALALRTLTLGPEHHDTLKSLNNLAFAYQDAGRTTDAIPLHERVVAISRAKWGPEHPDTLKSLTNLALAYGRNGQYAEAIPLFETVFSVREAILGFEHPDTLNALNNLVVAYYSVGRVTEAIPLQEQVLKHFRATLGPNHPKTLLALNNLASTYLEVGRSEQAIPLFTEALQLRRVEPGPDHPDTLTSMNNLAAAYQIDGQNTEAIRRFEELLPLRVAKLPEDHPDTLRTMYNLAQAYREDGRTAQAIAMFETVLSKRKAKLRTDHPDTLTTMNGLAAAYLETHRWVDAERLLRDCLERRKRTQPDDWRRFHTMSQLGAALAGQKRFDEAEPLLTGGYEGLLARESKISVRFKKDLTAAAARLVPFYEAWGKPDVAAGWRQKLAPLENPAKSQP